MSINCIFKCAYQEDGYCTLEELPSVSQIMQHTEGVFDCPYYKVL